MDQDTLDIISHSAAQTRRFGARLGMLLRPGDVVGLEGDLGTGKTSLVQGVGQGMGVAEPITSPTFTLVAEYRPPPPAPPLYHVDVYRLEDAPQEALAFGLDDYLGGDGVCIIEWAERIESLLPPERLWLRFRHLGESKRGILLHASGDRYRALLHEFRHSAFAV
ncbi:MAG: tRNA (adenosine(37)-N6)-threonylcarbamoyltransferase complex ATPase subunit type 1 TsaE [Anaerolineaceae bacterium]|nr:tRNA (adenosine(37)-N6)-threonylcarbamoyltransferase complex ATPase subunit type 1 TsaE [Anaerolineaceae bacterium]